MATGTLLKLKTTHSFRYAACPDHFPIVRHRRSRMLQHTAVQTLAERKIDPFVRTQFFPGCRHILGSSRNIFQHQQFFAQFTFAYPASVHYIQNLIFSSNSSSGRKGARFSIGIETIPPSGRALELRWGAVPTL